MEKNPNAGTNHKVNIGSNAIADIVLVYLIWKRVYNMGFFMRSINLAELSFSKQCNL